MSDIIPPPPPPPPPPPGVRSDNATEVCNNLQVITNRTDTSQAAAQWAMASGLASKQGMKVLDHLISCGAHGAADYELVAHTGVVTASVCSARNALINAGLVTKTTRRRTNPATMRSCIVWVATQAAQDPA